MDSSRFLQISDQILVEYIYTDQASPDVFPTDTYPIELMADGHNKGMYLFNTEAVATEMGNYRDISAASVKENDTEYAYLNTDVGVPYNDYDPELTDSVNLLQTFLPILDVEYDKVKIHFIAGFNFEGQYDGIIFDIQAIRRDSVYINMASINFLRTDTPVFNPDPLLLADKLYASYIEFRVPSLYWMLNTFNVNDPNCLGYKFTEGQGFLSSTPINIKARGIYLTTNENGYDIYSVKDINEAKINSRDIYDNFYAEVKEADDGDYFELSGQVVGSTFENFIATLNSTGGNYVVFHQITVSEQIGLSFVMTSEQMFTQTANFDEAVLFRPIILNSAIAVSFAINYTLRLYNKNDNTQIIKKARLVSNDPKKYGKRIMKINLGTVPTIAKVYNELPNDTGSQIVISNSSTNDADTSNKITEKLVVRTRYVTSFQDRRNIKASISPTQVQTITTSDGE
jgi:sRNA-binding regulator protein Hfq